jgi:cyclic pyranopterin phosphate synthase
LHTLVIPAKAGIHWAFQKIKMDPGFRRDDGSLRMAMKKLSHLDASNRPRMVDVGVKSPTPRVAVAEAVVHFPQAVADALREGGMRSAKGPVIDTAIVAGTMAAKRTHELIPFCHPLAIERCRIEADFVSDTDLAIRCEVAITHKTGVEMEALTGASVAALTVYDMCKALSHEIVIGPVRLLEKAGGKRRVTAGKTTAPVAPRTGS